MIGLGWWTAALGSIALANIPPSNVVAGIVVFGATVFGAACAVTAPFRLDRSLVPWVGTRLLVAFVAFGSLTALIRQTVFADVPASVVYTQTPVEVPAIVAGAIGSYCLLYAVGIVLQVGLNRGWAAVGRVRTVRRSVFVRRADR